MLEGVFPGQSELATRMRALDWTRTDLGPPQLLDTQLTKDAALWGPVITAQHIALD